MATKTVLRIVMACVALGAASFATLPSALASGGGSGSGGGNGSRVELRARLSVAGSLTRGNSTYKERGAERRFKAEIERADPNTAYQVSRNGVVLGSVTTNALGRGEFNLRTVTDNPGQQGPVPQMMPGDVITVGPVSGALATRR